MLSSPHPKQAAPRTRPEDTQAKSQHPSATGRHSNYANSDSADFQVASAGAESAGCPVGRFAGRRPVDGMAPGLLCFVSVQ